MPATLSNEELVGLSRQRMRKFYQLCGLLDETPDDETLLGIAKRFKKLKDAITLVETRLNTALASQNTTVDEL